MVKLSRSLVLSAAASVVVLARKQELPFQHLQDSTKEGASGYVDPKAWARKNMARGKGDPAAKSESILFAGLLNIYCALLSSALSPEASRHS